MEEGRKRGRERGRETEVKIITLANSRPYSRYYTSHNYYKSTHYTGPGTSGTAICCLINGAFTLHGTIKNNPYTGNHGMQIIFQADCINMAPRGSN